MNSKYFFVGMFLVVCLIVALGFGCAGRTPNPIDIQDGIMAIGECTMSTSGCVIENCGVLIADCAADKCNPVALSVCLVSQCGGEAAECLEEITEIIQD
jgi:hypothetical protein